MAHDSPPSPSTPIHLPEPYLHYRCNLKGCCCGGWTVTWRPEDIARLQAVMPPEELNALLRDHVTLRFEDDGKTVEAALLRVHERDARCPLLAGDGRCGLQERFGVEALPAICVDFPVAPYRLDGRVELAYRRPCPSVLDCVFADDGPVTWARLDAPDAMFRSRLQRVSPEPRLIFGDEEVPPAALRRLRDAVVAPFNDRQRPVLETLADVEWALGHLRRVRDLEGFVVHRAGDPMPFVRYLTHCLRTHEGVVLVDNLERYRRFVFGLDLDSLLDGLADALDAWEEPLARWVTPAEPELRPWLQRFLWLQFAQCFVSVQGELSYSFGLVTHELALALRYLAAFCAQRGGPPDLSLLHLALGAAALLFHGAATPFESQVWFEPELFLGDAPPPPQVPPSFTAAFQKRPVGPVEG